MPQEERKRPVTDVLGFHEAWWRPHGDAVATGMIVIRGTVAALKAV